VERPLASVAAESFDRSARVYDDHVAFNRAGALRLVAAVPKGRYPRLLDVACGTGFATLAAIPRLGVESVVAIDASAPMLEVFAERLAAFPGVTARLRARDVLAMGVDDGSVDLALCTMALHWFAERAAAIAAMARALAPGGVLAVLAPGPRHDRETVERIQATGDAALRRLADSIEDNQVDPDVLGGYIAAAGLEPLDVWTETRRRAVTTESYSARLEAVASHLWADLPEDEQADVVARMRGLLGERAGADGLYRYGFVKTFAIARAPDP
jgi:ubiquinone/menaquinone biosynthesis C-methylase UbiE